MIEFNITPRGSGKTQNIIDRISKNPEKSCVVLPTYTQLEEFKKRHPSKHLYTEDNFIHRNRETYDTYYFDEFFMFRNIGWQTVEYLNKQGNDIITYGTLTDPIEDHNMLKYLEEHYPEHLI